MDRIVYVERDGAGRIVATYANRQPGFAAEELAHGHPALAAGHAAWADIRAERDRRLAASDWTQLPDAPLGQAARERWAMYRRMLRALPAAAGTPDDITWPKPPEREALP